MIFTGAIKATSRGAAPHAGHFLCAAKDNELRRVVDGAGFLINSHDPLRGHVLKQCSPNTTACLRLIEAAHRGKRALCGVGERETVVFPRLSTDYPIPLLVYHVCSAYVSHLLIQLRDENGAEVQTVGLLHFCQFLNEFISVGGRC